MLEAEGTPGIIGKSKDLTLQMRNLIKALTHYIPSALPTPISSHLSPFVWVGLHFSYVGVLVTAEANANRSNNISLLDR